MTRTTQPVPIPVSAGRYRLRVYVGRANGKDVRRTITYTANSQREADRKAMGHANTLRQQATLQRPDSIAVLVDLWLNESGRERSPTTIDSYKTICRRICDEFGPIPVGELTAQDVRSWETRLTASGLAAGTVDRHHAVLGAILRQAASDGLIAQAVTSSVKRPRLNRRDISLPRDLVMQRLWDATTGDLAVAVRLAAATGLRRGELLGLKWSDLHRRTLRVCRVVIDVDGGHQVREVLKGKRDRTVPLDYETMRRLARHRTSRDGFILSPNGVDPYSPSWLSSAWAAVCKAQGVKVRLHDLRHWYATTLLQSKRVTIKDLQTLLGHAQPSTTLNIYSHVDPETLTTAASVIGAALGRRA